MEKNAFDLWNGRARHWEKIQPLPSCSCLSSPPLQLGEGGFACVYAVRRGRGRRSEETALRLEARRGFLERVPRGREGGGRSGEGGAAAAAVAAAEPLLLLPLACSRSWRPRRRRGAEENSNSNTVEVLLLFPFCAGAPSPTPSKRKWRERKMESRRRKRRATEEDDDDSDGGGGRRREKNPLSGPAAPPLRPGRRGPLEDARGPSRLGHFDVKPHKFS